MSNYTHASVMRLSLEYKFPAVGERALPSWGRENRIFERSSKWGKITACFAIEICKFTQWSGSETDF